MRIIVGREARKNKNRKEQGDDASYSERVRAKWFCCTFKVGFIQLICRSSLIFKSSLQLSLPIILK